jgi:hypothetical protein
MLKYLRITTQATTVISAGLINLVRIICGDSAATADALLTTADGTGIVKLDIASYTATHIDFDLALDGLTIVTGTANPDILVIWEERPEIEGLGEAGTE